MLCLINVFNDIMADFNNILYLNSNVLSRRFELKGKIVLLVSAYKHTKVAEISLSLYENYDNEIGKLPKWKGMNVSVGEIFDRNHNHTFISFKQAEDYEQKIYFMIMQDIVDSLDGIENKKIIPVLKEILAKWSTFFQFEKEYILSENIQQGLYGELYVLEKMIEICGEDIVECWTGCNAETHDFYMGKDALEVKSSSANGPGKIQVSNEYQLDDTGLRRLYLMYLKMRKSEVYGETLPDIVERIMWKLSTSYKIEFQEKLIRVGYLYQIPELYNLHFKIQDESCYTVEEEFPRITTKNICKGVGNINYVVSLDACDKFMITIETFYKEVST